MNKWIGTGRLTKDPELRPGKNDTTICNFTVAVDRRSKDAGADFIPCVAFNKTAEWIEKYFSKGKMIAIDGHVQIRNWTDDDGEKHYVTEVIVDNAEFCGDKSGDGSADSGTKKTTSAAKKDTSADDEEDPF